MAVCREEVLVAAWEVVVEAGATRGPEKVEVAELGAERGPERVEVVELGAEREPAGAGRAESHWPASRTSG